MSDASECNEYDATLATHTIIADTKEVVEADPKKCTGVYTTAPDLTQYVYSYQNDKNDMALNEGTVVHNRSWTYGLDRYASIVQVQVQFKSKCTFSFIDGSTTRTLIMADDSGHVHG